MNRPFATLSVEEQLAVREAQKRSKQLKKTKKQQAKQEKGTGDQPLEHDGPQRCVVTQDEYFSACPHGCFRDPSLPPRAASLDLLLRALEAGDEQAADLNKCCYFQFSGPERALWDPEFNARLAWEGFFTITTGRGGRIEPLPELQPFYGVLLFKHFEASKHVRDMLAQLARQRRGYRVSNDADPDRTWRHIEEYHKQRHSSNWLTRRYFEMMRAASDDPAINFTLNCIELTVDASGAAAEGGVGGVDGVADAPLVISVGSRARVDGLVGRSDLNGREARVLDFDVTAGRWSVEVALQCGGVERVRVKPANLTAVPPPPSPIAGEIGFTVGAVYTSLSGWTGERSSSRVGTAQLVLLGRWLQQHSYAFWSLGHCYSPGMDYKRQLGHRIYTRFEFRALLKRHRGPFKRGTGEEAGGGAAGGEGGDDQEDGRGEEGGGGFSPLRVGGGCDEATLLHCV